MGAGIEGRLRSVRAIVSRLRGVFGVRAWDDDFAREVESHLQLHVDDLVRAGLSKAEARRRAHLALGGAEQTREAYRDQKGIPMIDNFLRDLRHGARGLRRNKTFALAATAVLGLGVGTCTAMFSLVNALILRPLPFAEPERLVWIENNLGARSGLSERTSRADVMRAWQSESRTFASVAGYNAFSDYSRLTLTRNGEAETLRGFMVTRNFLETLGVTPVLGRNFSDEEGATNGPPALILAFDFWQRRLSGDTSIIGRSLSINGRPSLVVGVLPSSFDFDSTFTPGSQVDVLSIQPLNDATAQWGNTLFGVGRLRPGVTLDEARSELSVINEGLQKALARNLGAVVTPLDDAVRGRFRRPFAALGGAVLFVLAIACMNLSNLLLTRVNARRQEFDIRLTLGARRAHLIRQAMTESLLLAFAGSLVGVPFAMVATGFLSRMQAFGVPLLQNVTVDPAALAVSLILTTLAGAACGLLPALYLSREGAATLRTSAHQQTAGRSWTLARNGLIVGDVALACVLLAGAGLLVRSFESLLRVDVGFDPQHAIAWRIDPQREFKSGGDVEVYLGELARRVAALPGVEAVGLSDTLPLGRNRSWDAGAAGEQYPPGESPLAYPRLVDPGYLSAMRIPLVAGRGFDPSFDSRAPRGVIINETLARRLWPGRDPLGRQIDTGDKWTVIGVAGDVRHGSLESAGESEMYFDYRQNGDWNAMELVVRSRTPPERLIPMVRSALESFDPALPRREFRELEQLIDDAVASRRLITNLLGLFSGLALLLAAIGLYGLVAYSVTQRLPEIGVRMAIGATRADVLRLVLRGGLQLVALGIALGLVAASVLTGLLRGYLYGISPRDPLTFSAITVLLSTVALLACLLPAMRATRVDPMAVLRLE